ncbi:MAG: alpha-E domain-containing protein [bacterium]|nr:alpha-E domain-containing protein [bacterium]
MADSIYWASRYVERAENMARILDVNLNIGFDLPEGLEEQWEPLVQITGDQAYFEEHYPAPTKKNVIQFLVFDPDYPNSIFSCIRAARENARSVREIISSEMWQVLNRMFRQIDEATAGKLDDRDNPTEFFRVIKENAHLYTGVTDATFSHGEGWHFGNMGRFLERADQTTRIIDMKYFYLLPAPDQVDTPLDLMQWTALLKSASAFEMYRKTHGALHIRRIVDFLLLNRDFPRAVYKCISVTENSLEKILGESASENNPARRAIGRIFSELRYASIDEIFEVGVHEYVDRLQDSFKDASLEIRRAFFEPAGVG